MTVLALRPESPPRPEAQVALYWVGAGDTPAFLDGLEPAAAAVSRPERLPLGGADVVVAQTGPEASAESLLKRIRERCPRAEVVFLVPELNDLREVALLHSGASLVLDASRDDALNRARFLRTHQSAAQRVRLRNADPSTDGDEDVHGRRLMALSFASRLMTTVQDETEVFQRLIDILARELCSRRVSLMQVNRDAGVLEMKVAVGIPRDVVRAARARLGEGIAGTCAALGKPLFIDDHQRARSRGDLTEFVPDGSEFRNLPMSLTVPIKVKGEVVGVVNVTDRADNEPYSRQDIAFISALMGQAGYLLENATLLRHLHSLRAYSEQVVNTLTDPLAVIDDQFCVTSCNARFASQFSAQSGDNLWDRLPLDAGLRTALATATVGGGAPGVLAEWTLSERSYEPTVTPFAGERGTSRYLLFLRDVTVRRQMERRLVGAEKMASLGVLAAGVAHEINNPLAFVKSNARTAVDYLEDLLKVVRAWRSAASKAGENAAFAEPRALEAEIDLDFVTEDMQRLMTESVEGVERVEKIVQGLKSFAHPDTQKAHKVSILDLIENAVMLTQGKWKYKLELKRRFEEVESLWCLPNQLEQVFMNLVVNAAQAARDWGKLEISVRAVDEELEVAFTDTCGGIPESIRERIFEPFFTTKDIGEGTGLGLAIAYNIVENHGGRITVDCEEGVGSTFRVRLPLGDAAKPVVARQASRFRI